MDKFKFKLSPELAAVDPLGLDYEYGAIRHPDANDLFIISYLNGESWKTANYLEDEVEEMIENGYWIVIQ